MAIDVVSQLISASIRICGLALVAFVSLSVFRIRSSAARHAMWTVVLIGMLLQVPLEMVAPAVEVEVLPIPLIPAQPRVVEPTRTSNSLAHAFAPESHTRQAVTFRSSSWRATLTRIYIPISLLLFLRMAFGYWGLRKILRDSMPIPRLGPNVLESTRVVVPGSVGYFRARILLPREWRDWDAAKLGAVLAHERAHIERHDCLTRLASHINICVFWFHPIAWWIERELARLAEEACDDVAVSETNDKEGYVATLVEIAQTAAAHGRVLSWPVISMAADSSVTERVNRILKSTFRVPKPFGGLALAVLCVSSVPVIYVSAAVSLAPARRNSITTKHLLIPNRSAGELLQPSLQESTTATGLLANLASNQNLSPAIPPVPPPREERPFAICILLDTSGSMDEKRAEAMTAALALVKALKPHDEVCILGFDDEVFNGLPNEEGFTSDIKEMEEAISRIDARGGKAMRDAVQAGIDQLTATTHHERRVLVLITEGYDTSSKVAQKELLEKVKSSRVPVYCIGLLSEKVSQRQDAARGALSELADESGGLAFYPKSVAEVESIARQIADAGKR